MSGGASPGTSGVKIRLQAWLSTPTWRLLRFLAVITALCVVACVYFWQVSMIANMRNDTTQLQQEAAGLERTNAALMLQVAAWDRPDHIHAEAIRGGMVPAAEVAFIEAPASKVEDAAANRSENLTNWWQRLLDRLRSRSLSSKDHTQGVAQAGN